MLKMAETWINIEDDIEIMNEVVDAELYSIDNQYKENVFCINDIGEYENYLLIVPEEENNYTKMEIMDFLDKIQSYLKKSDMQHRERNRVDALKCSIQAHHI